MGDKRIAYIDFIKVFAMFIVTIGHCAQSLSCQTFPEKVIPNDFFVSIHMPLFMIASGFVLNFKKIREIPITDYIYGRFLRLIVPMLIWILIYSVFTVSIPSIGDFFIRYWYLSALFCSLVVFRLFSFLFKNDVALIVSSLLFVIAVPVFKTSLTNFMFPFLIYGVLLRKYINKMNVGYSVLFGSVFVLIYIFYWGLEHTVYLSPFDISNINKGMIISFFIRLLIGIAGSTFIFLIASHFDSHPIVQKFSKYGRYTLVFYTMTTVINGFTLRFLSFIGFNVTNPLILDILSIIFALLQMWIIYKLAKRVEKNKYISKFLLGI